MYFCAKQFQMNTLGKISLFKTTVEEVKEISKDVFVLSFLRTEEFIPGQMLALALKPDNQPRLYSIASGKEDEQYQILFNIQHQGYLTPRLSKVKVGDELFISKPFGSFYGSLEADWWIAAGTGMAPFLSMLKSGMAEKKTLIHGGRDKASFYFSDVFKNILKEKYIPCSSFEKTDDYFQGRITSFLKKTKELSRERNYFVCGSSEFVVDVRDILIQRGIPYQQIIAEIYF